MAVTLYQFTKVTDLYTDSWWFLRCANHTSIITFKTKIPTQAGRGGHRTTAETVPLSGQERRLAIGDCSSNRSSASTLHPCVPASIHPPVRLSIPYPTVQQKLPGTISDVPSTVFSTEGPHDSKADRPHVLVELTVYRLCPVASSAMWGQTDDCARLPGSSTRCRL